jgi:hypothetical protein
MSSLLRSGRWDSRRGTCEASTASKTTNALVHHSCDADARCCVGQSQLSSGNFESGVLARRAAFVLPVVERQRVV